MRDVSGQLEDALAKYTTLFNTAPIGYLVHNHRGRIRDANDAALALLGMPRQMLGEAMKKILLAFALMAATAASAQVRPPQFEVFGGVTWIRADISPARHHIRHILHAGRSQAGALRRAGNRYTP